MFASAGANEWSARVLAAAGAGLSFHWWKNKHNRHHKAPNQVGVDPDIADGPIAFVPEIAGQRSVCTAGSPAGRVGSSSRC